METTEKTIEILNDLIQINNDRVAGFEKAGENLDNEDNDLISVFSELASESRGYSAELAGLTRQYGGEAEEGTSASGSIHRAWLTVKSTFTGNDRESILDECERGEDAIKKAYSSALEDEDELPSEVEQVIMSQQQGIIEGHDLIKSLRDQSDNDGDQTTGNDIRGDYNTPSNSNEY